MSFMTVAGVLIVYGVFFSEKTTSETLSEAEMVQNLPAVLVATAADLNNPNRISLIGEVKAISEAEIKPEGSGKVTRVNVKLGQTVAPGQIVAELENASERASLLQAQGFYELALANSAQTDFGVGEAETRLDNSLQMIRNNNQTSYNTVNNVILGTVDLFFSRPESSIPGLKIGGGSNASYLNNERVAFQSILPKWRDGINKNRTFDEELNYNREIRSHVAQALNLINNLLPLLNDSRSIAGYSESEVEGFRQKLISAQSQITGTITDIDNSYTSLKNARENLDRALLSATGSDSSASDAQIKQALGSLRAAQANYEKTILRSPISGTVNSLNVKVGEFLSNMQSIATVANNGNSEIITFVSEQERDKIKMGDEVLINNAIKGQIAIIAPAINSATKKTEVRIAISESGLKIGETVRVVYENSIPKVTDKISVPLTAVKFDGTDSYIFVVSEGILERVPVAIGDIRGGFVEVTNGISNETEFVVDVRGRNVGERVEVINN